MSSSQKRYSREFKLEVVRRILETGRTQAEVTRELGIAANTLSRWMRQFRTEKAEFFPGKGSQTSQAALVSRFRRENERLRMKRDFLKNSRVLLLRSGFADDAAIKESDTE
jgi:transposase